MIQLNKIEKVKNKLQHKKSGFYLPLGVSMGISLGTGTKDTWPLDLNRNYTDTSAHSNSLTLIMNTYNAMFCVLCK